MNTNALIARGDELAVIEAFLDESGPRGLVLEGEPGVGKTSVWTAALDAARARGMVVLEARPTGSEVRLSFAGLSDLLGRLPESSFATLPPPQQRALDAALLRIDAARGATAARAVGQAL